MKEFAKLQIWRFCDEDMSPEPSELIVAFDSKVHFFRGFGPGVSEKGPMKYKNT